LGATIEAEIPYHPGLLAEILKAEIVDPLTLLFQKVMHITDFVGAPIADRGIGSGEELSVVRLRKRLRTAKVTKKPVPLRVTGIFSTAVLLSYGWWERTGPGAKPVGRNDIQRWAYAGFEEWAPSWDFNSAVAAEDESFFLGQLGHGDEADSLLVVAVGERARAIRPGITSLMGERKVAALSVEINGLLVPPKSPEQAQSGTRRRRATVASRLQLLPAAGLGQPPDHPGLRGPGLLFRVPVEVLVGQEQPPERCLADAERLLPDLGTHGPDQARRDRVQPGQPRTQAGVPHQAIRPDGTAAEVRAADHGDAEPELRRVRAPVRRGRPDVTR
jgi:hypothetical protein